MSKAILLPVFFVLNEFLFSILWICYTVRNEGMLMYAIAFSLMLGALLLLLQVGCAVLVKDVQLRRLNPWAIIVGLGLVCGAVSVAPAMKNYRFEADRKALEKAVAEVRTSGKSTAWRSVAYDMRAYPITGPIKEIYFCIARDRGYDCQWYRWTEKVHPTPDPDTKTQRPRKARELRHYWLSPQWSEYTTL